MVTSVGSLDALAATLIDPTSRTHRSRGYSVGELQMLSQAYGHSLIARKLTLTDLFNLSFPVIAWIDTGNGGHFTVVEGLVDDQILMADPTRVMSALVGPLGHRFGSKGRSVLYLPWRAKRDHGVTTLVL